MEGLNKSKPSRKESTPAIRAMVVTPSITSPGSSSCLMRRNLSSTTSSANAGSNHSSAYTPVKHSSSTYHPSPLTKSHMTQPKVVPQSRSVVPQLAGLEHPLCH